MVVAAAGAEPELCRVGGRIDPALDFELHLPVNWNRKAVFLGGAGYDGSIPMPNPLQPSPGMLRDGYVIIATDSGHRGSSFDGSWALGNPAAVEDFALTARHRVLLVAREIVHAHYGAPLWRAYFEGGSSGGREALIEAQRYPDDFDGVIARSPALSWTALQLAANRIAQRMFGTIGGGLAPRAVQTLSQAVLAACDGLDGLADGIVGNVAACRFDPLTLRCPQGGAEDCLTDEQIASVATVFSELQLDLTLVNGVDRYPAYPLSGAEAASAGWPLWLTGLSAGARASLLLTLQDQFFKFFVMEDPEFDSLTFSASLAAPRLLELSALFDATDPDLSAFRARGGKLILWHGLADYAISAYSTAEYYRRVVAAAGGQQDADAFVRFYTAPGVDHTATGAGSAIFDLLGALDAWVEDGVAPDDLIGYRLDGETFVPFRPLCRYPTIRTTSATTPPPRPASPAPPRERDTGQFQDQRDCKDCRDRGSLSLFGPRSTRVGDSIRTSA